ncbi:MAG: AsmA-like C-terminal region-containing protein [Kiritimatiellia bacterium]
MKDFFRLLLRIFAYLSLGCLALLLLGLVSLLCFEQTVPKSVLDRLTARVSSEDYIVGVESASFSLSRGLRLRNVRVLDRGYRYGPTNEPRRTVMSASRVDIAFDLNRLPWSRATILRAVTLTDLHYPRLPLGYYIPDSVEFPGQPDFREVNEALKLDLPDLRPFGVTLIRPEILGISTPRVTAPFVDVSPDGLRVRDIELTWVDADIPGPMLLRGEVAMDLRGQQLQGAVWGQTRQHHIRPLLVALDITNSYQFIDAFTKVEAPVDATCKFDVNLRNNDLHLWLDLHPRDGCYRSVPFKSVDGTLDIRVFVRETFQNARIEIAGPSTTGGLVGVLNDETSIGGRVVYENTNDVGTVNFLNVAVHAPLTNVLAIANVFTDGTFDCLSITSCVPTATIDGRVAVADEHAALNDLKGTLAFDAGSLFGIEMRQAATAFRVAGTTITFTNASASGLHGGKIRGGGVISVPDSRQDQASFEIDLTGDSLQLADVAQALDCDPGDRRGLVSGRVRLTGPLATNAVARMGGEGHLVCRDGHLAQMKLFAGLTDYLAKHVPGISGIVNLSRASSDFTLKDGVLRATNAVVEGNLISVRAEGGYDLVNDRLDCRAHVTLTRNESLLGKLATPITWPFANLAKVLLEFRIQGPLDDPKWTYSRNPLDLLPLRK